MSVIVQYIVKVPDVDRFVATSDKYAPMMDKMGSRNGSVYEDENEPGLMSTISEWDSHDQMHAASEKVGDDFNREADLFRVKEGRRNPLTCVSAAEAAFQLSQESRLVPPSSVGSLT
jgi:hypothetical protein